MPIVRQIFDRNRQWAEGITAEHPNFFKELSAEQHPDLLWIGCSDSRVPANQVTGLEPGRIFVHRNIANQVGHADLNALSTIQFAVDVLNVQHIVVCGHYGCGGVKAALEGSRFGVVDNWLGLIKSTVRKHQAILNALPDERARWDKLCELNVIEQVLRVCDTTVVQDAWEREQSLSVHGWVFDLETGLLKDLQARVNGAAQIMRVYNNALASII